MNRRRTPRPAARAQALVGLAALPLVLTTSNVGVTHASATRTGDSGPAPTSASLEAITADDLPDLPDSGTLEAVPAAFQVPERPALGTPRAGDIPWAALQAYRRAADILTEVQPSCGLSWTLLGAVGQVESEHGTARGGDLGGDGVVSPDLVSHALDGKGQRPAVEDTDGGEIDGDDTWDRAVGPMQLLPGVWSLVGVDGDGDGTRSPQDVDDAALAAAVYLCAVGTDLSDPEGAAEALAEYNGSAGYADQVLAVEKRYAGRDFAVSGAPEPSSIGATLDDSRGTPARESERALRKAQEQRQEPALTARRAQPSADAGPSPTAPVKPKPSATPMPSATPKPSPTAQPISPEPTSPEPTEKPSGTADAEAVEAAPAPRPDVLPTGHITEGAEPGQPSQTSAEGPTEGPTPGTREPGSEEPGQQGPADEPSDEPADQPADQPPGKPSQEPGEPSEEPGESERPGGDTGTPADDESETPADETETPTDEAAAPADDRGEAPAEDDSDEGTAQDGESTTTVTGVLTVCGEQLCLDDAVLDLTAAGDLDAEAGADLDRDEIVESLADELAGLEGHTVELLVVEGSEPLLVVAVDGHVVVPD